jgi:hypothetical protein
VAPTPDPLAGDVPPEPAPRTGWRRFTPWLAALLAVVVVVGWQVISRNPSLEAEGTTWSSPSAVPCGEVDVSLHSSADQNVTDGSALYTVLLRNASQFPVKLAADQPVPFRVSFTDVVDMSAPRRRARRDQLVGVRADRKVRLPRRVGGDAAAGNRRWRRLDPRGGPPAYDHAGNDHLAGLRTSGQRGDLRRQHAATGVHLLVRRHRDRGVSTVESFGGRQPRPDGDLPRPGAQSLSAPAPRAGRGRSRRTAAG